MASPVRKRVTDEVMQRVGDAVARAFRRDAAENSRWNLTARFAALTDPEAGRRSPQEQQVHELRLKLREKTR
jgi:hypothetical protein